jgi:molybdopterin/thiamine biosynthesis adenylyltransferase
MLTEDEVIRYTRQLPIKGCGTEIQIKLKRSRVFVAGTGGLGSPLLFYLTAVGVGNLIICDFDKIELSNLNRQILHSETNINRQKVDSTYSTLMDRNRNISITRVYEKLTRKNAERLIDNAELIIDCLDNFQTRHILNEYSVKKGIPMIHAGVSEFQGQITFLHPPKTACLACFYPQTPEKEKEPVPIIGATAGVLGSLQAIEAIKYLTGIGENLINRLLFWDGLEMRFESIMLSKNKKCKACS